MGTIDYMSPEQCENMADVDIRGDIYSLGCTFYYLVAGQPPYPENQFDTLRKTMMAHIVGSIPRLTDEIPETPAELEEIFERMLAKERYQRFQTPLELADALEPFADSEQLHGFLERWKREQGIGSGNPDSVHLRKPDTECKEHGKSTERIFAQSTKIQSKWDESDRRVLPHLAHGWRVIVTLIATLIAIPVLVAALLPFLPRTAKMNPQVEQAKLNLAQLPGLNGCWWFEEIPWFIPPVRELFMRKLAESPDTTAVPGNDPEKYFDPNVSAVDEWLWSLTEKYLNGLTPPQRELVVALHNFINDNNSESQNPLKSAIETFEASLSSEAKAIDLHTLANLKHRLAMFSENKGDAEIAVNCYETALAKYAEESRSSPDLEMLAILCRSDGLRVEYDYIAHAENKRIDHFDALFGKFEELCALCDMGKLSPMLEIEFRVAYATLATEAGKFDRAEHQFRLANKPLGDHILLMQAHPLKAYIAERRAWFLTDRWRMKEAEALFADAKRYRENNLEMSGNRHTMIYVLDNMQGLAMTAHYLGYSDSAEAQYRQAQNLIDKTISDWIASSQQGVPRDMQFPAGLYERAGNIRERRADCTFYGGAASGIGRERFGEMADLYRQAAEFHDAPGMKQVMRFKQAILLMLSGGEQFTEGETIFRKVADEKLELSGNQTRYDLMRQLAEAVLALQKNGATDGQPDEEEALSVSRQQSREALYRLLDMFSYPTNPNPVTISEDESGRRENLEIWLFASELLLNDLLENGEYDLATRDLIHLVSALSVLRKNRQVSRADLEPFTRRFLDLSSRVREK
jgi:tetratricopeptide (TPR) repeat protein